MIEKEKIRSTLSSVPETMLWTLHNRATEAMRDEGVLRDEKCIEIYNSIDYDYKKSFGEAEPSHALRSVAFDTEIRTFLKDYPTGTIVNLGEGLETQRFRIKKNSAFWISVDLPSAIQIRECFIKPDLQHLHSPVSALDRKWLTLVPSDEAVFITGQGLFMYFNEEEIKSLFQDICSTFNNGYIMFDTIPKWISNKTMSVKGWQKTGNYTAPQMPWGINRNAFSVFKKWSLNIQEVLEIDGYQFPRGITKWLFRLTLAAPLLNRYLPSIVKIKFLKK